MKTSIIGVGGAGVNSINHMINSSTSNIQFIGINSNPEHLGDSKTDVKILIGKNPGPLTITGGNPAIGQEACLQSQDKIRDKLKGQHAAFILSGLGGGTGGGASPVIADICRGLGLLVIAVGFYPFAFETKKQERYALDAIKKLNAASVPVILIYNNRLRGITENNDLMVNVFRRTDEMIRDFLLTIIDEVSFNPEEIINNDLLNDLLNGLLKKCNKDLQHICEIV